MIHKFIDTLICQIYLYAYYVLIWYIQEAFGEQIQF